MRRSTHAILYRRATLRIADDGEIWVAGDHVERCDVNAAPEPPFAALTLRSGAICYISDPRSMTKLQRLMGVELPRVEG